MCVCVCVYLVEVLIVECCTQRSLMTDYITIRIVRLIMMAWLQGTQLGETRGRRKRGGGGRGRRREEGKRGRGGRRERESTRECKGFSLEVQCASQG